MPLPLVWGATEADVRRRYPADDQLPGDVLRMTRAVGVAAPAELTWRWLCQLSVAPYSYDWIDNRGRRSPRELTPGAEDLRVGHVVQIFDVLEVDQGRQWTGRATRSARRAFGPVAVTYAVEPVVPAPAAGAPDAERASRLICRIVVGVDGVLPRLRGRLLAWGDLVMMRKELLTLKRLAERDASRTSSAAGRNPRAPRRSD